jgi:hypothetical protein
MKAAAQPSIEQEESWYQLCIRLGGVPQVAEVAKHRERIRQFALERLQQKLNASQYRDH